MKLQRCDPRPFVCGHSAEIITLLFFVFRAKFLCGNDKKKSNYNYKCSKSFKLLHCEQWSVYTWIFFLGGGGAVSILCFYVVGPWIRSNKTLPLTVYYDDCGGFVVICTYAKSENKLHSRFSFDGALSMHVYLLP